MSDTEKPLQSADAQATPRAYEAPRVVQLGPSTKLIRGNWTSGVWDRIQGNKQWYVSGE